MTANQADDIIGAMRRRGLSWDQISIMIGTMVEGGAVSEKAHERLYYAARYHRDLEKYGPEGPQFVR